MLYGDNKNYLVAMVSLDADELSALAEQTGADADQETMADSDAVRSEISDAIEAANANFARVEQVKNFGILPRSLSTDHGELTSTLEGEAQDRPRQPPRCLRGALRRRLTGPRSTTVLGR